MPAVVLLAGAEADSLDIFMRLEARNPEAADGFFRRLDESLGQLALHPESAPVFEGKFRRLVMRGFPLGIFSPWKVNAFSFRRFWICVRARRTSAVALGSKNETRALLRNRGSPDGRSLLPFSYD